jgi:hypothetical protein
MVEVELVPIVPLRKSVARMLSRHAQGAETGVLPVFILQAGTLALATREPLLSTHKQPAPSEIRSLTA